MKRKRERQKEREDEKRVTALGRFIRHMAGLGFTNRCAIYILLFLVAGIAGGFILAVLSIRYQYAGALACWTVVFTPIGTAVGVVLGKIVDKNRAENVSGNGDGITFAAAAANGFAKETKTGQQSPPI